MGGPEDKCTAILPTMSTMSMLPNNQLYKLFIFLALVDQVADFYNQNIQLATKGCNSKNANFENFVFVI